MFFVQQYLYSQNKDKIEGGLSVLWRGKDEVYRPDNVSGQLLVNLATWIEYLQMYCERSFCCRGVGVGDYTLWLKYRHRKPDIWRSYA